MWESPNGFGWALERLKAGERVFRRGWNGKGMWLALAPRGALPAMISKWEARMLPHIVMKTVQGEFVPWSASSTDLLETDWEVAS